METTPPPPQQHHHQQLSKGSLPQELSVAAAAAPEAA